MLENVRASKFGWAGNARFSRQDEALVAMAKEPLNAQVTKLTVCVDTTTAGLGGSVGHWTPSSAASCRNTRRHLMRVHPLTHEVRGPDLQPAFASTPGSPRRFEAWTSNIAHHSD